MIRPTREALIAALEKFAGRNNYPSDGDWECPVCGGQILCCPHLTHDLQAWLDSHPAPDRWFADERGAVSAVEAPHATAELKRLDATTVDGGTTTFSPDPFATGPTLDGKPIGVKLGLDDRPLSIDVVDALGKQASPPAALRETRVTDPKTGGQKGVKLERFDLVPFEPLTALARLYGKGAIKYEPDNWRRGYAWRLSLGGMLRHVSLWAVGKSWDTADGTKDGPIEVDEAGKPIHTGEHHLTCAAWHCFTLYVFETQNRGTDDRVKSA